MAVQRRYPTPSEAGVKIPRLAREELFKAGFLYGLKGGSPERLEHLRFSFRMGLRAAKILLRRLRREQGVIEFPQRWKVRVQSEYEPGQHGDISADFKFMHHSIRREGKS